MEEKWFTINKYIEKYINGEPYGNIIVASFMPKKRDLIVVESHTCDHCELFTELFLESLVHGVVCPHNYVLHLLIIMFWERLKFLQSIIIYTLCV